MQLLAAPQTTAGDDLEQAQSSYTMQGMELSGQCDDALVHRPFKLGGMWGKSLFVLFSCLALFLVSQCRESDNQNVAWKPYEGNSTRRLQALEFVHMSISTDSKCRGRPPSGWANLGRDLQPDKCQASCLMDPACKFVVYRPENGACTTFASCDKPKTAPGFSVFAKQETVISFAPSLDSLAESCIRAPRKAPFKVLGCRGTDSRCSAYSAPDAANERSCKALRKEGAACSWAREDPSGSCIGHDSRCGQDSYKTEWRCNQLKKVGASCSWKKSQSEAEDTEVATNKKEIQEQVHALSEQMNSLIPLSNADSTALLLLLEGAASEAECRSHVFSIGESISTYADATRKMRLALNPQTPTEELLSLVGEASGPSTLNNFFAAFRQNYAPKVFGCTGHHSGCAGQPNANACKQAGGDCSWATTQQSGRCMGNDSRCSVAPIQQWKEGCNALKAQRASCSWVASQTYEEDTAQLVEKLQGITSVSASAFQDVLSNDFEQRLVAIESAAASIERSLAGLKIALGMGS